MGDRCHRARLSEAGVEVTTLTTDHDVEFHGRSSASAAEDGVRRIYAHKWLDDYKVAPGLVPLLCGRCSGMTLYTSTRSSRSPRPPPRG